MYYLKNFFYITLRRNIFIIIFDIDFAMNAGASASYLKKYYEQNIQNT
jgi:hypothetical protein